MAIFSDYSSFVQEIGRMRDWYELRRLGIPALCFDCAYTKVDLPDLRAFCAANPQFHIISRLTLRVVVNHEHADGVLFFIGKGNADPTLSLLDQGSLFMDMETLRDLLSQLNTD